MTSTSHMQAAAASFSETSLGHKFQLRVPLAKATANKCALADCGCDIRAHSRSEVTDEQLLAVLNCQDDGRASVILPGEMSVGGFKAVLAVCDSTAVLNCAGRKLHSFIPNTLTRFEQLRNASPQRLLDLEWEDSESFNIALDDIISALAWARAQLANGHELLINCAQGKSRSGTLAVAYVMAKYKLSVGDALAKVQASRANTGPKTRDGSPSHRSSVSLPHS